MRTIVPLLALALPGCLPFGLGGVVAGEELSFVDATYAELRDIDVATATPIHPIGVWLMPMEDPCADFDPFVAELERLREELDFGMAPETYCDQWEGTFEEYTGLEGFWIGHVRLNALPRGESEGVATDYDFYEESAAGSPEGPSFDLDLAWYPPPTFDACATEFSGESFYAPTLYTATGGGVRVMQYSEDTSLAARLEPEMAEGGDDPIRGRVDIDFCPEALDWGLEFGLGGGTR